MTNIELISLATTIAKEAGIDPALVCAVVEQESMWNPVATRFEPAFKKHYIDPMGLDELEAHARSTSWGLMQLMGEVAREMGYKEALQGLLEPSSGLFWGCRHLSHKLSQAKGDTEKTLLLWNGGANKLYPSQVMARLGKYK